MLSRLYYSVHKYRQSTAWQPVYHSTTALVAMARLYFKCIFVLTVPDYRSFANDF